MELRPTDAFFLQHDENTNVCLQFLREYILGLDKNISETLKWGLPFFLYRKKMCCYLSVDKKSKQPYIGIVEGGLVDNPSLIKENRARMKVLLINQDEDLPMETIEDILRQMVAIYNTEER